MDISKLKLNRNSFGRSEDRGNVPSEAEAISLMTDWVKNEKLRLHMLQVGEVLYQWAVKREGLSGQEARKWKAAGILHDADWDQWPEQHCSKIIGHLEATHTDPEIIRAIASHSPNVFGVEPQRRLDFMIYAVDELSGFVHAVSLVRPEAYAGMTVKSVNKKLKSPAFAAQVNREEINDGAARAGLELSDLISFIIEAQAGVIL